MNDTLNQQMRAVLTETVRMLFPLYPKPQELVKPHVWRNKHYLGEVNGKIPVWQGMSANLVSVDFRYRAVFVDVVENALPTSERLRLFGPDFTQAIADMKQFVIMFVLDFPRSSFDTIKQQGFVPRTMGRVLHACIISSVEDFMATPALQLSASVVRLVMLQRVLSIHRKPLDANEVPLQNLMFKSGYLHHYILSGGLELHRLDKPRKAGEFGHDLHAIVSNPATNLSRFAVGVEVYMGPIAYHAQTIPDYATHFQLKGVVVVSKDDPTPTLLQLADKFPQPPYIAPQLAQVGATSGVAIHHLPLDKVVSDFSTLRDELEALIPVVPKGH